MARGDIKLRYQVNPEFSVVRNIAAGVAGSVNAGEPTKSVDAAAASPYLGTVAIMVDGDGSTAQRFAGISKNDSNDTVAAAGEVLTWLPLPGLLYAAKAKTASTADTAAEVAALRGKRVVFDLTASKWTVDAAAADAVANCVVIVDGDFLTQTLYFAYAPHGTFLDFSISA